jgi:hypothetical protein
MRTLAARWAPASRRHSRVLCREGLDRAGRGVLDDREPAWRHGPDRRDSAHGGGDHAREKRVSDPLHVEVDVLAKYVESLLAARPEQMQKEK